jgi:hypothetical protein
MPSLEFEIPEPVKYDIAIEGDEEDHFELAYVPAIGDRLFLGRYKGMVEVIGRTWYPTNFDDSPSVTLEVRNTDA